MDLGSLKPANGARQHDKRIGRGHGSGYGKTAGRGSKGQLSRSGHTKRAWFEGGQMPIQRRLPKRGFHSPFRTEYQVVNVSDLQKIKKKKITIDVLVEYGLVQPNYGPVKILGDGDSPKNLKVSAHAFSKSAEEKITSAGGSVEVI